MSSALRRIQRRAARKRPDYEAPEAPIRYLANGGYQALHPTRGWRTFSGKRLLAGQMVADRLAHSIPKRPRKAPKVWRAPAPVPPSTETRQQARAARRKGYSHG